MRSVSHYVKNEKYQHLVDAELKRDAGAFITQEMHHSIEHRAYNKSIETKYGHDDMEIRYTAIKNHSTIIENIPVVGHLILLSITCSLEHITALLGELLLATAEGNYILDHMAPSVSHATNKVLAGYTLTQINNCFICLPSTGVFGRGTQLKRWNTR